VAGSASRHRLPAGDVRAAIVALVFSALAAEAQDRPFAFAYSPGAWKQDGTLVFVAPGYADAAPSGVARDGFESRFGLETRFSKRLSLLGGVSFAEAPEAGSAANFQLEALYDVLGGAGGFRLAAGSGYRREGEGASVWLGRVVGERSFNGGRLLGDLRLEKPFIEGRDAMDVIVTLAAARHLGRGFSAGAELVGEDLEALWEVEEAEGGGRILIGPSLHWRRADGRFVATLAGGPVFRFNANRQESLAPRNLGNGFAVRVSLAYVF
jgi:hypothetical protein